MSKRILIAAVFVFSFLTMKATHIVGGEFQMLEQRSGLYDIYLHLYFDEINGNPAAEDPSLVASIYAKSNNELKAQVTMEKVSKIPVQYENPDCAIPEVSTSKITYAAINNVDVGYGFQFTSDYNDPQGYYIVWDRCCRNDQIVNIQTPGDVGMVFYLQFPRIFDSNGNLTGWSSPVFAAVPGTYACVGEYFEMDFSATDLDGDSLVYSMRDPIAGYSNPNDPNPALTAPEPYPTVTWAVGVTTNNQIPGTPPLSVNPQTGILTATPLNSGLHVFSVLCEEYRNNVKIGELRRDFQVFVDPDCTPNDAPKVELEFNGSSYTEGDTITMTADNLSCFDLFITDDADLRNNEEVSVHVVPVNFIMNENLVIPGSDRFVGGSGDTLTGWQVCTPGCDDVLENEPFIYDIIVSDDGCPIPKRDTIRMYLEVIPTPNEVPRLEVTSNDNITYLPNGDVEINIFEIDTLTLNFTGYDPDSTNTLTLDAIPDQFSLNDFGMVWEDVRGPAPIISADFEWIISCEKLEGSEKDDFSIDFVIDDGSCDGKGKDTINVRIILNYEVVTEDFIGYNIFTPNGDGHNETFVISNLPRDNCVNQYVSFEIYNRWGKKVYESNSRKIEWDGDDLSDGVYFYVARYTEESYKGHFTIFR